MRVSARDGTIGGMQGGRVREALRRLTAPADLVTTRPDGRLECSACAHRCALHDGTAGLCGVRWRDGHILRVPEGYVAARRIRTVETNTVYHVLPGAQALIFGMFGCDLRCPYCHNWRVSQAAREEVPLLPDRVSAEALVDEAVAAGCSVLAAAYNEPMIAAEWVRAVFAEARARGLVTVIVSDGNTTPEALAYLRPVTQVYRVDLKAFTDEQYAVLGGRLGIVLEAITHARQLGYWVEVVTLVVPGFNDDPGGLRALASHLAALDVDIPWHLNAFYPRYRWNDRPRQGAGLLVTVAGAAYAKGLRYVYVGNLGGGTAPLSHTRCPECHRIVVSRRDYRTLGVDLVDGRCPDCATPVAGLWTSVGTGRFCYTGRR
jgi:pyruvate formate lyase activating enzyme